MWEHQNEYYLCIGRVHDALASRLKGMQPAQFLRVFFSFFFSLKKLSQLRGAEPATWHWASYVALSQLRGTEPATWHWASKVALSFELARRQWASKVALSFIIYIYIHIPMQSQPYNILNLGQNIFFWGRHVPLSWSGNVKSTIRFFKAHVCNT